MKRDIWYDLEFCPDFLEFNHLPSCGHVETNRFTDDEFHVELKRPPPAERGGICFLLLGVIYLCFIPLWSWKEKTSSSEILHRKTQEYVWQMKKECRQVDTLISCSVSVAAENIWGQILQSVHMGNLKLCLKN